MKKIHSFVCAAGILFLCGCVPSFFPVYTDKDLTFNENLLGSWTNDDKTETWIFSKKDSNTYALTCVGENEGKTKTADTFDARLAKLGKYFFLDTFPSGSNCSGPDYNAHFMAMHMIMKIEAGKEKLSFSMLNDKWLQKALKEKKTDIETIADGDRIFMAAPTDKLQQFYLKWAGDKEAFSQKTTLLRLARP